MCRVTTTSVEAVSAVTDLLLSAWVNMHAVNYLLWEASLKVLSTLQGKPFLSYFCVGP